MEGIWFLPPFELYLPFVQTQGSVLVPVVVEALRDRISQICKMCLLSRDLPFLPVIHEYGDGFPFHPKHFFDASTEGVGDMRIFLHCVVLMLLRCAIILMKTQSSCDVLCCLRQGFQWLRLASDLLISQR